MSLLFTFLAAEKFLHHNLTDAARIAQLRNLGLRTTLSTAEVAEQISIMLSSGFTAEVVVAYLKRLLLYISSKSTEIDPKQLPREIPYHFSNSIRNRILIWHLDGFRYFLRLQKSISGFRGQ